MKFDCNVTHGSKIYIQASYCVNIIINLVTFVDSIYFITIVYIQYHEVSKNFKYVEYMYIVAYVVGNTTDLLKLWCGNTYGTRREFSLKTCSK